MPRLVSSHSAGAATGEPPRWQTRVGAVADDRHPGGRERGQRKHTGLRKRRLRRESHMHVGACVSAGLHRDTSQHPGMHGVFGWLGVRRPSGGMHEGQARFGPAGPSGMVTGVQGWDAG